jgi:exodeoxyribonuclease-3
LKIATWNVNGIRARQAQLQDWIAAERPDVVCLQEIKASSDQIPTAICEMEGYWCYWHGGKGYSGVGLHVSKRIAAERPEFVHPAFDYENRIVLVRLPAITVVSVYVPNGGKDFPAKMRFLAALEEFAADLRRDPNPIVICGDLNIARADMDVHPKERKPRAIGQLPEERAQLERIIDHGLVDVGRALEPDNDQMFTWWAPWRNMRQRNIGWRLDYLLASAALFDRVRSCRIERETGTSDHAPVVAEFAL